MPEIRKVENPRNLDPDQKFSLFLDDMAAKRGCTFVADTFDGRECPELIDGMAVDDVWGWLIPNGESKKDKFFGFFRWSIANGKLEVAWNVSNSTD